MLVAIHAVDYDAVGLGDFGHPDGYLERQVRALGRAVGAVEDARAARRSTSSRAGCAPRSPSRRRRRSCTATTASTTRCSRPTIPAGSSRCSTGRCRRSATRSPTSGCSSSTGATPQTDGGRCRRRASPTSPGSSRATRCVERYAKQSRPRPQPARLLRGVRGVQARDHRRGHPRPIPHGQDGRRGLRRDGRDGRGARRERARGREPFVESRGSRLTHDADADVRARLHVPADVRPGGGTRRASGRGTTPRSRPARPRPPRRTRARPTESGRSSTTSAGGREDVGGREGLCDRLQRTPGRADRVEDPRERQQQRDESPREDLGTLADAQDQADHDEADGPADEQQRARRTGSARSRGS